MAASYGQAGWGFALPDAQAGKEPVLTTKLADGSWAFVWDGRRKVGYLIAAPKDGAHELKFTVEWQACDADASAKRREPVKK